MLNKRTLTFKDFMEMQDIINEITTPDWNNIRTKNEFKTAMFDEFSELLNSASFKWWKKGKPANMWNMKIEAVDVLHFALSIYLLRSARGNSQLFDRFHDVSFGYAVTRNDPVMMKDGIIDHNVFINSALAMIAVDSPVHLQDFVCAIGFSVEELSAIYTAKVTLNEIRQLQGYKTGEYKKIRDNVEDNDLMKESVDMFLSDKTLTLDFIRENVYYLFGVDKHEKEEGQKEIKQLSR